MNVIAANEWKRVVRLPTGEYAVQTLAHNHPELPDGDVACQWTVAAADRAWLVNTIRELRGLPVAWEDDD
jgi:hypothetical protein